MELRIINKADKAEATKTLAEMAGFPSSSDSLEPLGTHRELWLGSGAFRSVADQGAVRPETNSIECTLSRRGRHQALWIDSTLLVVIVAVGKAVNNWLVSDSGISSDILPHAYQISPSSGIPPVQFNTQRPNTYTNLWTYPHGSHIWGMGRATANAKTEVKWKKGN